MAGETAKPGWIANVNPFVVVCCMVHHQMDGETHGHYFHEYQLFLILFLHCWWHAEICWAAILREWAILPWWWYRHCGTNVGGMFYFSRYLNISHCRLRGRRRYVSRVQPSPFFSVIHFRIWHSGCVTDQILSRSGFVCKSGSRKRPVWTHYIWYYFAGIGLVAAVALLILPKPPNSSTKKKVWSLYCIFSVYLSPNAKTGCFRHNLGTLNSALICTVFAVIFLKSDGFVIK